MKKLLLCASAFALLLGSCSKDDAEVAPVDVQGKLAFSAAMTIGNDTRTGAVVEGGNLKYTWDLGDMVGATVKNLSEVVPFINQNTTKGSKTANFYYSEEDFKYVGGEEVFLAYPYEKDNKVDANGNINMTIPANQRYRDASFAPMTAPAVAYVPNFEEGAEYTFRAVSSFIRVPVIGSGSVSKIEMQIKTSNNPLKIAGSADVDVDSDTPALTVPASADSWSDKITLDFGKNVLNLSHSEKKYIVFVLPAGLELQKTNTVFEFKATFSDASTSTATFTVPENFTMPVNHMQTLGTISFGMEDKVLIGSNAEFIEYLYAVSKGTGDPAATDYVKDGAFKTAILTGDLNFNRYDARNDINGADGVLQAALTEYMANGNAIAPIAAGAKIDGGNYTVSYLAVKGDAIRGNGIFGVAAASLKNITFSNTTVTPADADEENPVFFGVLPAECEGVTVYGGTLVTTAENAAVLGEIELGDLNKVTVKSYPRNSYKASVYYAAKITLGDDVNASDLAVIAYFNSSDRRFGAIKATSDVKISGVTTKYVPNLLAAISYEGTDKAISVLDKTTSYWTGGVAESVAAGTTIETAEQLAYVVKNGRSRLTLGKNIDLQGNEGKVWTVAGKTVAIDGGSKTITNAKIGFIDAESPVATGYYSLLGNNVTVSNLTVSNVKIDVDNVTSRAYVGGLGLAGSANGVTVSDLSIKIGSNVKAINGNVIGGLVSTLSAASAGNVVKDLTIDLGGKEGVTVGGLFGILNRKNEINFDGNSVGYKEAAAVKYPLLGAWTVYASTDVAACSVGVVVGDQLTVSSEENPIAPVVGVITFNPANVNPGTQISLNFDKCSTPYYSEIKNAVDYAYNVKINGKDVAVYKPE